MMLFWQDVVLTIPPYPYALGEPSDVPLDERWAVRRPQASAFFLLPSAANGGRQPKRANFTYGADDIQVQLVPSSPWFCPEAASSGPMEAVGSAEAVLALTHAHPLCGLTR